MPLNLMSKSSLPPLRSPFIVDGDSTLNNGVHRYHNVNHTRGGGDGSPAMNNSGVGQSNGATDILAHVAASDDRLANMEQMMTAMSVKNDSVVSSIKELQEQMTTSIARASTDCGHAEVIGILRAHGEWLTGQVQARDVMVNDLIQETRDLTNKLCVAILSKSESQVNTSSIVPMASPSIPFDMAAAQMYHEHVVQHSRAMQQITSPPPPIVTQPAPLMMMTAAMAASSMDTSAEAQNEEQRRRAEQSIVPAVTAASLTLDTIEVQQEQNPLQTMVETAINSVTTTETIVDVEEEELSTVPLLAMTTESVSTASEVGISFPTRKPFGELPVEKFIVAPSFGKVSGVAFGKPPSTMAVSGNPFGALSQNKDGWKGFGEGFKCVTTPKPMFGGSAATGDTADGEDHPEAYEADVDFKPICPLPDVIDAKTGEEDEEVLFKARAKLYRFVDGEFKERGIGELKVLEHKETTKVRCVMRRDIVHKPCANFALTPDLSLRPMAQSDKAWTWICHDYSEEEMHLETLAVRFKTIELAQEFKTVVERACKAAVDVTSPMAKPTGETSSQGFGDQFKLSSTSWECSICLMVAPKGERCAVCNVAEGETETKLKSAPFLFGQPIVGSSSTHVFGLPADHPTSYRDAVLTPPANTLEIDEEVLGEEVGEDGTFTPQEEDEAMILAELSERALVRDETAMEKDD